VAMLDALTEVPSEGGIGLEGLGEERGTRRDATGGVLLPAGSMRGIQVYSPG